MCTGAARREHRSGEWWIPAHESSVCDGEPCRSAPGGTVVVPWVDVMGWSEVTTRVIVYWWPVASEGQGRWRMDDETSLSREVVLP
jgi:hypothetical protein